MKVGLKDYVLALWSGFLKPWPILGLLPSRDFLSFSLLGTEVGDTRAASSVPWLTDTVGLEGLGQGTTSPEQGRPTSCHSFQATKTSWKRSAFPVSDNMQITFACCDIMDTRCSWRGASQNTWNLFKMAQCLERDWGNASVQLPMCALRGFILFPEEVAGRA